MRVSVYLSGRLWRECFNVLCLLCLFWLSEIGMAYQPQAPTPINVEQYQYFDISQHDMDFEGKRYRLFIAKPKQSQVSQAVLYMVDGNAQFPLAVNHVDVSKPLPLIVGIGYVSDLAYAVAERTRDYTVPAEGEEFVKGGGAKDFLRFVATEVKPYVEEHYLFDKKKQFFFGHSFGGLFGLYVLFNKSQLFQYYTIASPSLWWGNGAIIPERHQWIEGKVGSILVTLGEYEAYPKRNPQNTKENIYRIKQRQLKINAIQLVELLKQQEQHVDFSLLPKANHGQAILPAIIMTLERIQN